MLTVNVKIALKKIDKNSKLMPRLVSWYTKSEYYHVELVVGNVWVSVFPDTGVKLNALKPLKDTWSYVDLDEIVLTSEQHSLFIDYLHKQENKEYDYLGIIFAQILPLKMHKNNKWFCSELVVKLLQMLYVKETFDLLPASTSPGDLERIFLKG